MLIVINYASQLILFLVNGASKFNQMFTTHNLVLCITWYQLHETRVFLSTCQLYFYDGFCHYGFLFLAKYSNDDDDTTPVLKEFHRLPVRQWIIFETAVLVFRCSHGMAPTYLADHCKPTTMNTSRCYLWSANLGQFSVP